MALTPAADKLWNQFGRVLQVAVHDDDGLAAGMLQSGRHRCLMTEITAQSDNHSLLVLFMEIVQQVGGRVAAAVVDEQDLIFERG